MRWAMFGVGFIVIALMTFVYAVFGPAHSHSWYPTACCSEKDCEPIPVDAVTERADGSYHVRYLSKQGFMVDAIVPYNEVRVSQDGGFHGCASPVRFLCFFAPVNT